MGRDWHDAGQEDRDATIASLREQIAEARTSAPKRDVGECGDIVPLFDDVPFPEAPPDMDAREAKETPVSGIINKETELELWRSLRIKVTEGMDLPRFEYIGGLFPRGGVSFIAARAGDFKTWIVMRLAIDLSLGGVVLDGMRYNEPPRKVLYVAGEAHWDLFVRRAGYMRWNATQDTLYLYDSRLIDKAGLSVMMDNDKTRAHVEVLIEDIKPDIVFFDSFSDFFFADENKAVEMKPIVRWLETLAQEKNIAIVLPHHHSKRKPSERQKDFDQDDLIGSSILQRLAHLILTLKRKVMPDGEEAVCVKCTRSRNRYPLPFAFRIEDEDNFDDENHHTRMKVFLNPDMGATKKDKVVEFIEASFDVGQWFSKKEVVDLAAGEIGVRSIEETLRELQKRGIIIDNGQKTNKLKYSRKGV